MSKSKWIAALFGAGMGLAVAGAALGEGAPASASGAVGKVVAVDAPRRSVRLAHEAIPALGWPGMTMDFAVDAKVSLDGAHPGDAVVFSLARNPDGTWRITRMERKAK